MMKIRDDELDVPIENLIRQVFDALKPWSGTPNNVLPTLEETS